LSLTIYIYILQTYSIISINIEIGRFGASTVFHMTWVSQFCSVVGLDDIDGLLAGSEFIGLIVYVFARASIL